MFSTWLNLFAHKICRVWTSQVFHFSVETTNCAEIEHSVLKVWLSTCHGDLDTVFLNVDSLIQSQIAEIKYTLKISKPKEKYGAKSNAILKNLSNKVSHLALKKIMDELKKAREMVEEPRSNCLHYLRKSHGLPCACELIHRDMDSEMRDLTLLIHEISIGPISKVQEARRIIKGIISPTVITKGRQKTNSTERDKSHWEYVSIAHRKIGKSSDSGSGGSSSCGRGRPPRSGRGGGRGRKSDRSIEHVNKLIRRTNWKEGSAPVAYWMDTPDHLYVIANTFNLCVVFLARLGSTTVLSLISNMDGNAGTIFIGFIEEQQHFIQLPVSESHWEYTRDLYPRVTARDVPTHVIIRAGTRIPQHVHPIVWRPACLLKLDRVGGNILPIPELSQNTVKHVRLDVVKICNKAMAGGNPASPNLLHPVRHPPNFIRCHHIQSYANIQ
ncbi:hypothetical protein M9H77_06239 [Catharanthus roseus]|uniref:Uncharacterized protein n=1 Tax=Catharanthus roseus TaxID=4058 RepID=A0ACC0BRL4_CATRO|nr:hypothetical protein M9H77_06239 [Catharanthus roseus]